MKIQGIGNSFGNIMDTFQEYSSICEISYKYAHYFIGPLEITLRVTPVLTLLHPWANTVCRDYFLATPSSS
jgi:hypothetical protein